ncbi:MAG: hypothetical protein A3F73_09330 [Gallionellales bacterium RIFCSPLOWO2_12_FULL_59_22]|nr:MAG: hypothetical protein A3H99_13135 [Gallionellales bacterium RIFCSPLOWO2_02_FULL_59_110]OGT14612.1 MAG: hypothetical protein A3F73_09330 [Gallionellales bacterium RIFCSPLOWO2_12_FULL_59_22]
MKETIFISVERIKELLQFRGSAIVLGEDGRWKCSSRKHCKEKLSAEWKRFKASKQAGATPPNGI